MEYIAVGILVLLVVAAGATLIMRASRSRQEGDALSAPFSGSDRTPLGDTAEHSDVTA